jgi:hypothetical protein
MAASFNQPPTVPTLDASMVLLGTTEADSQAPWSAFPAYTAQLLAAQIPCDLEHSVQAVPGQSDATGAATTASNPSIADLPRPDGVDASNPTTVSPSEVPTAASGGVVVGGGGDGITTGSHPPSPPPRRVANFGGARQGPALSDLTDAEHIAAKYVYRARTTSCHILVVFAIDGGFVVYFCVCVCICI